MCVLLSRLDLSCLLLTVYVFFVCSDPEALKLEGLEEDRSISSMSVTMFLTGLIVDLVSWTYVVDRSRANRFIFPATIKICSLLCYTSLATGYAPVLMDNVGRRLYCLRWVLLAL